MSVLDNLQEAKQQARRSKEQEKLSLLQVVLSAIQNKRIEKKDDFSDEDVLRILQQQIKQLNDALGDFRRASREDLVQKTEKEINIIASFLPQQLTPEEIETIIHQTIDEMHPQGQQDFGKVMGVVMKKVNGRADGKAVQDLVKANLPN